jgi:hypothetical protein
MRSTRAWGCSRYRNGECANPLRIPGGELERAVLGAVEAALDEEVAHHALEVALFELRARLARADRTGLAAQLAALDAKIGRALDLAIELGEMEAAKAKSSAGSARRWRPSWPGRRGRCPRSRSSSRSCGRASPIFERSSRPTRASGASGWARSSATTGCGSTGTGRIEGTATLQPEALRAPRSASEPAAVGVAGASYAHASLPPPVPLVVAGRVAA